MNGPAGWYAQPDGREKYWDGQEWIAIRPTVVGAPAEEPSNLRPTRTWRQKRFILPGAALGVALGLIVIVASINAGASESGNAGPAIHAQATPLVPESMPSATEEPSADPTETMRPARAVESDRPQSMPSPRASLPVPVRVPPLKPVKPIAPLVEAPPVEAPSVYQEPTITCPTRGLTIAPGPVTLKPMMEGLEGFYVFRSDGVVTNHSSAAMYLWDFAPDLESLDGGGNVLATISGGKFVYSAPRGEPKGLGFILKSGDSVPYVLERDALQLDLTVHVTWYTFTTYMSSNWSAAQFAAECPDPSITVVQ